MDVKVKLDDLLEHMEFESDEYTAYINVKTGEVVLIYDHYLRRADEGEYDGIDDLNEEEKVALDYAENWENYEELPTPDNVDEYEMIEDFCLTVKDEKEKSVLLTVIKGKGAFRRFKDTLFNIGLIEDWYKYRDQCYKQIAIDFCEDLGLEYA